ncbi:MAG: internal scaffolding protein [Arizlama microvirus]|nr:MAG: internal scaffolding protein [Arizlama microvirus]
MEFKIRANYQPSEDKGIDFKNSPSLTKQSDAAGCDINNILAKFEKTGVLPDLIKADGRYGDFANVPDYQEAVQAVSLAQEQFGALSAQVRERFGNDPANMLEFCSNPANAKEMVKLGLAVAKPISQLDPVAEAAAKASTAGSVPAAAGAQNS